MNTPEKSSQTEGTENLPNNTDKEKATVTHNLDTGKDELLADLDDEPTMDFGAGSGGGSAPAG